jgi:hypothetical protein
MRVEELRTQRLKLTGAATWFFELHSLTGGPGSLTER